MSKSKEDEQLLIDSKVSSSQTKLAIDALLKHALKHISEKEQTELLPGKDQFVWLVLTTKKVHAEKKLKPFKLPLAHPLIDPRTTPICLITKDPQREYKDLLESNNIKFISRVVGIQKLKGKFKPFEARRMLLKENGLFLADERVVPLLPKLLGKPFFNAKKQPLPVCLTRKDLKKELEGAVSSTYFHQNQGTCSSVKVGTVGFHNATQLFDNLKKSLPSTIKCVKGGWDNIQSIHIKTSSSASLPIWSCELNGGEGGRWDGLTATPAVVPKQSDEEEEEEAKSGEEDKPVAELKKAKKRQAPKVVAEDKPQKKQKLKVAGEEPPKPKKPSKKPASTSSASVAKKAITPADTPAVTKTKPAVVPSSKREKKPRPTTADFFPESEDSPLPAPTSSRVSTTVAEQPSNKKKKHKKLSEASPDKPASVTASKPAAPAASVKAKDKTPPAKTRALASGIEKKKERLIGQSGKSKTGKVVGKSAKDVLLKKKAAAARR